MNPGHRMIRHLFCVLGPARAVRPKQQQHQQQQQNIRVAVFFLWGGELASLFSPITSQPHPKFRGLASDRPWRWAVVNCLPKWFSCPNWVVSSWKRAQVNYNIYPSVKSNFKGWPVNPPSLFLNLRLPITNSRWEFIEMMITFRINPPNIHFVFVYCLSLLSIFPHFNLQYYFAFPINIQLYLIHGETRGVDRDSQKNKYTRSKFKSK